MSEIRLLWLLMLVFALWGAVNLSNLTWIRYQESPTVVSMDRDMYAWNTTFPGVTICPHTKVDEIKLANYVMSSGVPNKRDLEHFLRKLAVANYSNFQDIPEYTEIESSDYMQLLLNLSFSFSSTLTTGTSSTPMFLEPTVTELGLCYAVNSKTAIYNAPSYREANRWDYIENNNDSFNVHPLEGEVFAQVLNMSTGYDAFIHGPLETPDIAAQRHVSLEGYYMKLYFKALSIYTTDAAKGLSVSQRKCRFPHENNLKHNSVYSYNLCRMECRIKLSKEHCGCIPHFYRKIKGEKVCDVQGLHCLAKYGDTLYRLKNDPNAARLCSCYPNCEDVNYVTQYLVKQRWFLGTNLQWGIETYPRLRYRRDVIFGFTDVLVAVGGMAGLFLGCSVLSFIEIIYFASLRLIWYCVHKKRTEKLLATENNDTY